MSRITLSAPPADHVQAAGRAFRGPAEPGVSRVSPEEIELGVAFASQRTPAAPVVAELVLEEDDCPVP